MTVHKQSLHSFVRVPMSPESSLEIQSSHSAYAACSILHKFSFSFPFPSHFPFPWCPVLHGDGKFSNNNKKTMGVPDFVEESLISYESGDPRVPPKFGELGPLFHIKNATQGPHFEGSPFSLYTGKPGSRCSNLLYQ